MARRLLVALAAVALATVALAACGEGAGPDSARCSSASDALLQTIADGLTVDGATLTSGFVVRSDQFEDVYMVAAEIDGPGLEGAGDVGVWATNDTAGGGSILSVADTAKERSSWPIGSESNDELTIMADGAMEAEACAGG
jgi:hypothetical protein